MLSVISENDVIVPPSENTLLLRKKVQSFGHDIELIRVKEGTSATGGITLPTRDRIVWFAFFWSMETLSGGDCFIQKTVNTVFGSQVCVPEGI